MIIGNELVETLYDDIFTKVRSGFGVSDEFLLSNFDFENLREGGGKGGSLLSRSLCGNFFVKELSKSDKHTILSGSFCELYSECVLSRDSLLCRILCIFTRRVDGKLYIAMGNCIPISEKSWDLIYDLKGTADDKTLVRNGKTVDEVHKRFWRLDWMFLEAIGKVTKNRLRYVQGKREAFTSSIILTTEQKKEIMTTIKRDLQFFVEQDLMDYSMIVAIKQIDKVHEKISFESTAIHEDMYNSFKVWDGDKLYIVYVGIIDFLQGWTMGKRVAHVIKCMFAPKPISTVHPVVYAEQFENFFEKKFCTT